MKILQLFKNYLYIITIKYIINKLYYINRKKC
jgi:hypothetical protein